MVTHDILLAAPPFLGGTERPVILERTDQDFLRNVLAAFDSDTGRAGLSQCLARAKSGKLELFRPMHRTFHLALVDARCQTFGSPRLDPRRIESAGIVIRRVVDGGVQGWMQGADGFRGWLPLPEGQRHDDPDPQRRARPSSGHALVDAHLVRRLNIASGYREAESRLFVAPPATCSAAGATLLYGLLPLGTAETTSKPPDSSFSSTEVKNLLPGLLRAGKAMSLPNASGVLRVADAKREDAAYKHYASAIEQLLVQFDLRGEGARAGELRKLLAALTVQYTDTESGTALDHVQRAIDVLIQREDASGTGVRMPREWPSLSLAQENAFAAVVRELLAERFALFAPRIGRFDAEGAEYELWAFARVRSEDGCPPKLWWSKPSQRFIVASWFEAGPVAPVLIPLPDITRANIKKLKPNVAFAVPPSLFNFLQANTPEKLIDGEGKEGPASPAIAWICGFNLSIIFMIAFIIMFVFVILLNIVFQWLAFIKICIPIPASFKSKM